MLVGLIGAEAQIITAGSQIIAAPGTERMAVGDDLDVWERRIEEQIATDDSVQETDREAIIREGAARVSSKCASRALSTTAGSLA